MRSILVDGHCGSSTKMK